MSDIMQQIPFGRLMESILDEYRSWAVAGDLVFDMSMSCAAIPGCLPDKGGGL